MKTKHIIAMLCLSATMAVSARNDTTNVTVQNDSQAAKPKWCTLYGFIRTDLFAQNRKMESVVEELMPFYPTPASFNEYGEDVNKIASAGFYSMTTRVGLKFNGKGVLGADRIGGCIEADFTAGTNCTSLFFRKAFVQLFWKKSDLIIGQTWHPLCTENIMPNTLSINVGAPYAPFSRNPQARYTYHFDRFNVIGAIVYQAASTSVGPDATDESVQISSNKFQKNAIIPNVYIGGEYSHRSWIAGIGLDYKAINPVNTYLNYEDQTKINNRLLHTFSAMIYGQYEKNLFNISAKAIIGSNLCEHKIIGGYAIGQRLVTVGDLQGYMLDFQPLGTFTSYINTSYGKLFKGNLFAGYSVNLGAASELDNTYTFYGFGKSNGQVVKDIYRVGASFTYNPKQWTFGIEVQYNNAAWGTLSKKCLFSDVCRTGGLWLDAAAIYTF